MLFQHWETQCNWMLRLLTYVVETDFRSTQTEMHNLNKVMSQTSSVFIENIPDVWNSVVFWNPALQIFLPFRENQTLRYFRSTWVPFFPLPPSRRDSLACFSWFTSWDESVQTNSREAAQRPLEEQKRSSLSLWAGFTVQRQQEGRRVIYVGPFIRESGIQIQCGIFLWKTNKY